MKKTLLFLLCTLLGLSSMTLPLQAVEEDFSAFDLVEDYRTVRDSESGTKSWHEAHGVGHDFPVRYSSKDLGYTTYVRNQGSTGMCWAFAMIGAMEVNINKKGLSDRGQSLDLSEAHLGKYVFSPETDPLGLTAEDEIVTSSPYFFIDAGFSAISSAFTLAKGIGPVYEDEVPFSNKYNVPDGLGFHREFTLTDAELPWVADEETVKRLILERGAAAIAYTSTGDEDDGYVLSGGFGNHIVQLIGWDDTIPKESFSPAADHDGAWLLKNSWGLGRGDYFWLSYDSGAMEVVAPNVSTRDVYDNNYYYDGSNTLAQYESNGGETIKIANIFTGQKGSSTKVERVHAIGVGVGSYNTVYELQLYKNPEVGNPESGEPMLDEPLTGIKINRGYYTIPLPQSFEIEKGESVAAVFTLRNRNANHVVSVEIAASEVGRYEVKEHTDPHQSYMQRENATWKDLSDDGQCVRIHMLTNMDDLDYAPTKTLNPDDFALTHTEVIYTGEVQQPMVEVKNKQLLDIIDYGIRYENNLNVGEGKVIIYGTNDYEGSEVVLPFTIKNTSFDHNKIKVSHESIMSATGSQIRPSVQVTYYDRILKEGIDYTVSYGTNIVDDETSTDGSITVTGKGYYEGSKTTYFDIRENKFNKKIQVSITPGNVAVAPMRSEAYIGEDIMLTVGNMDYDYSFVQWELDGITFNRIQDTDRLIVHDDYQLHVTFLERLQPETLATRYNELKDVEKGNASDEQWALFQKELAFSQQMVQLNDDNDMRYAQALYFLNLAYENLDSTTNRSAAKAYLEELANEQFLMEDYETIGWGKFMYQYTLLQRAIEDIDITQEKLDEVVTNTRNAYQQLIPKGEDVVDTLRNTLSVLYAEKSSLNQDLYTISSFTTLQEALVEADALLKQEEVSEESLQQMIQRLNSITLVEKGDATSLKALLDLVEGLDASKYEETSYQQLMNVYRDAKTLYEGRYDKSQSQIDLAKADLQAAYDDLDEKVVVNKERLENLLLHARQILEDGKVYTTETKLPFETAYHQAMSIYEDDDTNQEEVNTAATSLETTMQQLIELIAPNKVTNVKVRQDSYKDVTLTWNASEQATSYDIYRKTYKEGAQFVWVQNVEGTSASIKGLMSGKEYSFYVVAKNEAGISESSEVVSFATQLEGKPTLTMEKASDTKFTLKWTKVDGATRYIIYRKRNKEAYKKVLTLGGNVFTYTTKEMVAGDYHFIVKAGRYDSIDRIMSDESNEVSGTSTYGRVNLSLNAGVKQITLNWEAVEGIKYYEVYRATQKDGRYTKLKTTTETNYVAKSLTSNKTYYFKVRGYQKYNDTKLYSPYSSIQSMKAK